MGQIERFPVVKCLQSQWVPPGHMGSVRKQACREKANALVCRWALGVGEEVLVTPPPVRPEKHWW